MKIQHNGQQICLGTGSGSLQGDGQAITFIHGAGFDHSVWVMPARYFARHGFRVLAPDLPAHGASDGPALSTIEQMADWLAELLAAQAIEHSILVGHSMGSLIALACATRHPQLVDKLILLGTSAPMPVGSVLLDAAADDSPAAFAMANTWSHVHPGGLGASRTPGVSNFVSGARWLQRMQPGVYHADLAACHLYEPELPASPPPTCVINGAMDKMTPVKSGMSLARRLGEHQDVQTHTIPGCGHAMLSERPNEVLDVMSGFILNDA